MSGDSVRRLHGPQIAPPTAIGSSASISDDGTREATVKVLVILGHPRRDSLGGSLFGAFAEGSAASGVDTQLLVLSELKFDPNVHYPSPRDQPLEDDLQWAQDLISAADHLVFVFPTWWGTMPALLKGFLDRVFTPGFAFKYQPHGHHRPLLTGKTAEIITTMDTPYWVFYWIYGRPGVKSLTRCTLGFCGVETVRTQVYGPVITSDLAQRAEWLREVREAGRRLPDGPRSQWQRRRRHAASWLLAIRPQFYPMTLIAYALGALSVRATLDVTTFWLGYLMLLLIEVATVFTNDYFDFGSDRRNRNAGPFTGGSRMLVERRLAFGQLRWGSLFTIAAAVTVFAVLLSRGLSGASCVAVGLLFILALGYTVPPLKLSHRGLGELDVALTHSVGVIVIGHLLQGGDWTDGLPWMLSLPLFLAVFAAILLSGVPDYEADRAARKRTLVVKFGKAFALKTAIVCVVAAATIVTLFSVTGMTGAYGWSVLAIDFHAILLGRKLRHCLSRRDPQRIDGLMALALAYIIWFGAVPLWHFATAW